MKIPRYLAIVIFSIFGLVVLLPVIFMFAQAFMGTELIGLDFLKAIFLNSRQWTLMKNSLLLSSGVTLLSLILGILLAILFERTNIFAHQVLRLIYFIPLLIPPYIHAIAWTQLLAKQEWARSWLKIHSLLGAVFVLTFAYFPFMTLMTMSGLKLVNPHLEEASLIHHGPLKTIKSITLPLVTPHICAGATFVFIFSLVNFSVPDILRVSVYPVEIFVQFSAFFNERAATLLSLPLILIAITLISLQKRYMEERSYISIGGARERKPWVNFSSVVNALCFLFCLMLFTLSLFLPVIVLFKAAGPFSNYVKCFSTSKEQIGYSILLAFLGALGTMILAFFIAYSIERRSDWKRPCMEFAAMIPFAIPAIVFGIGLIKVWNHSWTNFIYGSSAIIIFGYIARFIPFGIWTVQASLKQIPIHLEEAGTLVTSRCGKTLKKIVLPLCYPGLAAGLFIIFILSLGELATTLLIIPPGKSTLPIKIYNLMHYGADNMVAALSLILIGIIIVFSGIFLSLHRLMGQIKAAG